MALAQRVNSFGINHPGLNFLSGLVLGATIVAVVAIAALTYQSGSGVEAASFTASSVGEEWTAPRLNGPTGGSFAPQTEEEAIWVSRQSGGQTFSFAAAQTEEEAIAAPRVAGSQPQSQNQASPLGGTWSSEEDAMAAGRVLAN